MPRTVVKKDEPTVRAVGPSRLDRPPTVPRPKHEPPKEGLVTVQTFAPLTHPSARTKAKYHLVSEEVMYQTEEGKLISLEDLPTPTRKRVDMMGKALRVPTTQWPPQLTEALREKPLTVRLFEAVDIALAPKPWSMEARYPYMRQPSREAEQRIAKEVGFIPVGFIGTFERYVRPDIPTPSTAVLQPFFEGGKLTEAQFLAEHPGYGLGGLVGEWFQAKYVFGPIMERGLAWAKETRVGKWVGEKIPGRIKGIFVKKEEVIQWVKQPQTEPPWMRAMRLEKLRSEEWLRKFRFSYKLEVAGRARSFVEASRLTGGTLRTPFRTTLEKAVPSLTVVKTGTGQQLLLKMGQELATETRTLTLTKAPLIAKQVTMISAKEAGKVAYKPIVQTITKPSILSKALASVVPSLLRYQGPKLPSLFEMQKPLGVTKTRPYPISTVKVKPYPTTISKTEVSSLEKSMSDIVTRQQTQLENTQKQIQQSLQITQTKLISPQKTLQRQMRVRPPPPRWPPYRERRRRKKRKDEDFFGLFGRYKREYPVMTPKKALKFLVDL